jgi:hypothetical protein
MSWGARTKNLHSQLIRSNGSGSFGGQGVEDCFLLALEKQTNKKTALLLQEIWNEAKCKAKQSKIMKLWQTSSKEKRVAAANKQSKAKQSKQASKKKGVLWSLAKNRVTLS